MLKIYRKHFKYIVILQCCDYTKFLMFSDITNSPLSLNFELFVAFFVVAFVERATLKMRM